MALHGAPKLPKLGAAQIKNFALWHLVIGNLLYELEPTISMLSGLLEFCQKASRMYRGMHCSRLGFGKTMFNGQFEVSYVFEMASFIYNIWQKVHGCVFL